MLTRIQKPTLATEASTAAAVTEAASVEGDYDSSRNIGGLSPTNSVDRKMMTEDEVSTLVQNALLRARQATSSFSPRGSPTSSRGGGGGGGGRALSPSSVGSSSSWGVRSSAQTDAAAAATTTSTTTLLQKQRSSNNSTSRVPSYTINTNLPPRSSRYSSSSPRTPQTPYSTSSIDGFSTPGGSYASSDFVDLSNSSSILSTDYDGEQSIGTTASSDEIIRKVEEEIANARKAAQEASRRLADVSANLTVKRSTSSGMHTGFDDEEEDKEEDSSSFIVTKSTSIDSMSQKNETTTKDDDLQEGNGARSLDHHVTGSSNKPKVSGLSTSADRFTILSGHPTMLDNIGNEFDEQHIYDSAMGVMGEEFDTMDDTVGRSNKSSRRLNVSGLFSMEDNGVGRLPTPSFGSVQQEQRIATKSSAESIQPFGETNPAQGTFENPVDVSAMPEEDEKYSEGKQKESEEMRQITSVDLSGIPNNEVPHSEEEEEEVEECPVISIDSSDTPHDEMEQQSQEGKKGEEEEVEEYPVISTDSSATPHDELEQQSQEGKKGVEGDVKEFPVASLDSSNTPHDEAEQQSLDGKKEVKDQSGAHLHDTPIDFQDTPDDEKWNFEESKEEVEELTRTSTCETSPKIEVTHTSDDEIEVAMSPSEEIESLLQPGSDEIKEAEEEEEKCIDAKSFSRNSFEHHDHAPPNGDTLRKDCMNPDSFEEEHVSNKMQFDEQSMITEREEPFDESFGTKHETLTDECQSSEKDHISNEDTTITKNQESTDDEKSENDDQIEKSDSQVFIYQAHSAGSADAVATARLYRADVNDNYSNSASKTDDDEGIEEAIELVTEEVNKMNIRQDDEFPAGKSCEQSSDSQSAAEGDETNCMKDEECSVSNKIEQSCNDDTRERRQMAVTTNEEQTPRANGEEEALSKESDQQKKHGRQRAVSDRSRKVKFKQRYPVPPQARKPRDPAEIIMDHRKTSSTSSLQLSKPKKDLSELLEAAVGSSLARRSNACGALKVLSTQKKNKLTLVHTAGFLDAMVFAIKEEISEGDREHGITARTRAVNVVLNVSEAKDNRPYILNHPGMADALVKCLIDDDGEGRVLACAVLATLAKTGHCREAIAATNNMIDNLAFILRGDDPSKHRRGDKQSSRKSKSRRAEEEKKYCSDDEDDDSCSTSSTGMMARDSDAKKRARMNACAVLLHLSKECSISQELCSSGTLKDALVASSREVNNPIHTKCLEIMCNLSRFPHNNADLVKYPGLVDTLVHNGHHDDDVDRLWSVRTLQNLSSDPSAKCCLAQLEVLELLSMSMMRQKHEEQLAATSALYNISTEPGAVVPLTNTRNVVATLVHVAHSPTSESTVRTIACDALATLGLWLQTLSGSGTYPEGVTAVPLPSYMTTGWKRWEA